MLIRSNETQAQRGMYIGRRLLEVRSECSKDNARANSNVGCDVSFRWQGTVRLQLCTISDNVDFFSSRDNLPID